MGIVGGRGAAGWDGGGVKMRREEKRVRCEMWEMRMLDLGRLG